MSHRDFYFERFGEEPTEVNVFNKLIQRGSLEILPRIFLGIGNEDLSIISEKEYEEYIIRENRKQLLNEINDD